MFKKALYMKIYEHIVDKISTGEYEVGDLLPSENDLEKMFQVSKTPIRQALKQLEQDKYIYRLQGRGSFVANRKPQEMWTQLTGFGYQYMQEWDKISAKTIEAAIIECPQYAIALGLDPQTEIIHLKRIRYYNSEPLAYMEHYIKPVIPLENFTKNARTVSSVDEIIKEKLGIKYDLVEDELEAISANSEIAEKLELELHTPILKGTRITFHESKPIDINVYYRSTKDWKYKVSYRGDN